MMDYIVFHQAMLVSLTNTKDSFEKANQLDMKNGGEDFAYEEAYKSIYNYVITGNRTHETDMNRFIQNLLESAYEKILPMAEPNEKDFAKKTFLIIMADSIMKRLP